MHLSYDEQIKNHIEFLNNHGLDVQTLEFGKFIRCHAIDDLHEGRGKYSYICNRNNMRNPGSIGLITWCRGKSGKKGSLKTFGKAPSYSIQSSDSIPNRHQEIASKAYGFWSYSSSSGLSDYLILKGVGSYAIRFRSSMPYGNVAVIPMRDETGKLWSYQLLNPNGQKRFPKEARTAGLFHALHPLQDGRPIGIAESYVTAATCYELCGISAVCCFSADNMRAVTESIRRLYPKSHLLLFADNDRHLEIEGKGNKGVLAALKSIEAVGEGVFMVEPDFVDIPASKEVSDWNDLVRLTGSETAKALIQHKIIKQIGG